MLVTKKMLVNPTDLTYPKPTPETSQLICIENQLTCFFIIGNIGPFWVKKFSLHYQAKFKSFSL